VGSIRPVLRNGSRAARLSRLSSTGMEMESHICSRTSITHHRILFGRRRPSGFQMRRTSPACYEPPPASDLNAGVWRSSWRTSSGFTCRLRGLSQPILGRQDTGGSTATHARPSSGCFAADRAAPPHRELYQGTDRLRRLGPPGEGAQEELKCIVEFADKMKNLPPPTIGGAAATPETASTGQGTAMANRAGSASAGDN